MTTIAEKNEHGYEIIDDAMKILVMIYNSIPQEELDKTPVTFPAGRICEIIEMFFSYVDENEDIDIQKLMESTNMELSSNILSIEGEDEPKVH